MTTVAAIGRPSEIAGLALAGVHVIPARSAAEAIAAWQSLPPDTGVVILTEQTARAVTEERAASGAPLTVVMPS